MAERGEPYNLKRYSQVFDFRGLCWGNITPTDIDLCLDFHNEYFVFGEAKVVGNALPEGQRKAFERMVQRITFSGGKAIFIVFEHSTPPQAMIDAEHCPVVEYYYKDQWRKPMQPISLKQAIDKFISNGTK